MEQFCIRCLCYMYVCVWPGIESSQWWTKSIVAIFKNGLCYGSSYFINTLPLHQNRLNLSLSLTHTHTLINVTFTRQGVRNATRYSSVPVVMDTRSYPAQVQCSWRSPRSAPPLATLPCGSEGAGQSAAASRLCWATTHKKPRKCDKYIVLEKFHVLTNTACSL